MEVLERLASGWWCGTGGAGGRGKMWLAIEPPMEEGQELEKTELPVGMEEGPFKERGGSGSGSLVRYRKSRWD